MKDAFLEKLNLAAQSLRSGRYKQLGYPFTQDSQMSEFYRWALENELLDMTLINVGSPFKEQWAMLNTDYFESKCVEFLADAYAFKGPRWGFVSNGGTDGNMHGIYYGRKKLQTQSSRQPIIYVSQEAHYSVKKLADVQNTPLCLIETDVQGRMCVEDLKRQLDPQRPALIVYAIGGTFKGAIDDQIALNAVIKEVNPVAVYRHLDIALFGGYLPFINDPKANSIIDQSQMGFDSVAVSGHKFFSMNDPCGVFISTKAVYDSIQAESVPYLNGSVPTISCSRSGFDPLKLYWQLHRLGVEGLRKQADLMLEMSDYLFNAMLKKGIRAYKNEFSNTIFFERPSEAIINEYALAKGECPYLGQLAHLVVMQFFTKEICDTFLEKMILDKR